MVKKCHAHTLNPIRCQQCQQAEHCHHRSAQLSWSRLLHAAVGGMLTVMTFMTVMIPPSVLSERESGQLDRVLALKGVEGFKTTTPWRVGWITSAAFALTMDTPEIQSSSQDTVKTIEPVVNTLDPFDAAENLKNDASGSSGSSELPELQESVLRISAMGTSGVLRIATPALIPEDELDQLQADLVVALETLEQDLSTWNRDSALSRFNDSPSTDFTVVPSSLVVLTELTQAISKTTDGLYDTTVAPLVDLWGFGVEISPVVPSAEQINALLPIVGWQGIQTDRATNSIRKKNPNTKIVLNSIAKGYGVDLVAEVLEHRGLQRYLIEIGGEIRASGLNKNHRPWLVAIERPSLMITGAQIILGLENVSVATSGVYRNFVTIEDRSYPHILNPKTGYPIPLSVVSASVIVDHKNAVYPITEASRYHAAIADGLATAVVVVGAERALQIAEQHQVGLYLLVYQGSQINPILTTENTRPMWNKAFERVALSCPLSEIWTTSVALR